ncbi:tetratricopeptide repeat protein [Sphingomonas sp.]|uniref:tetratricopeptide repeat protein n=1 Tax=Sphingomonas sp. TaxID=28214 RepID=UPI001B1FF38C|nr:tetratricopeptide repeat protein [Sphingomonas sp.]MBO9713713.1 tetratricopeptide repeat protein [Sphingomonas sp.]
MKARISGRAAAFAVRRAKGWQLSYRGNPTVFNVKEMDVVRALGRTADTIEVDVKTIGEVERRLEIEWAKDRALRFAVLLLDPNEVTEGLEKVAAVLEDLLARDYVISHLESQFYQHELPPEADLGRATSLSDALPRLGELLSNLKERQQIIGQVFNSFEALPDSLFGGTDEKAAYRERAVAAGAFRSLVILSRDGILDDPAIFDLHERLAGLPDARRIVAAWTSSFGRTVSNLPPMRPDLADLTDDYDKDVVDFGGGPGGHQRLRNALEQQAAILDRVADGDYDNARRFARDLVQQQLATAGPSYLAKSLTRLSQRAREMDAFELELEWAYEAAEIQPDDARARTQFADALLQADRIEEALEEFGRGYELGERVYAINGRARAMRMLGRFDEELKLYQEACDLSEGSPEGVHSLVGIATARTDLGDIDGAIEELRGAISKFPFEPLPRIALATTLTQRGRFEEAWTQFQEAATLSADKLPSVNGLADICLRIGRLDEARRRYSDIANRYPRDISGHIGLIDTLRALGELNQAAMYARRTAERFPGSPKAIVKFAETASELGRHALARKILQAGIEKFPKHARLLIARTSAFRREGRYDRALQFAEAAAARFPYNRQLQRVRADMLRRLGQNDLSARIYRELVSSDETDVRSRNGLASVLIVEGKTSDARSLVENDNPQTKDEWRGFLLFASLIERLGDRQASWERLNWAKDHCPFAVERRLFACALAGQSARMGRARQAPRIEHIAERDIGNVIDFQIAAMTRRSSAKIAYGALTRNLPTNLEIIRDEIAKTYGIVEGRPRRSKAWIGRQIADNLLLAA